MSAPGAAPGAPAPAPIVLVVSNPDAAGEICDVLVAAGNRVLSGDGSDSTMSLFEDFGPHVVVLCADLDGGDARAMAAAIRASEWGRLSSIVLVGEQHGPIRTALDAMDFSVDRFIGRPLSHKALAFAVRVSAEAALAARVAAAGTGESDDGEDAPVGQLVRAAFDEMVTAAEGGEAVSITGDGDTGDAEETEAGGGADAGPWDEPPPPWREPTLILSGGGSAPPEAVSEPPVPEAVPEPIGLDVTERSSEEEAWGAQASMVVAPVDELDDGVEPRRATAAGPAGDDVDPGEPVADDDGETADEPRGEAPTGGDFARELRRKMSAMAERLFPGRSDAARAAVDVAHDHHTEIDLADIGTDTEVGIDTHAPYAPFSGAPTFAHDEAPMRGSVELSGEPGTGSSPGSESGSFSGSDTAATTGTGLPRAGAVVRGEQDAATLMAMAFRDGMTGQIVFRRAPAEKAVHFEDGRPVFATSNLPHDRMGELLYREGKITGEQRARSRELVLESGRRMGEVLVEMGFLKRRELLPAVRRHVEDIIYSLFAWEDGEFFVAGGDFAASERIRLSRHPAAMILEGVRRKYDRHTLEELIGPPGAVIRTREAERVKTVVDVADLSVAEHRAIGALDGERTLAEVAEAAGLPVLSVQHLAYGLIVLGAADSIRRGEDTEIDASFRAPSLVGETDLAIDRQRVLAKFSLVGEADYFALLGVRRDATGFEIRRAYEAARRDYACESFPAEVQQELGDEISEIGELLEEAYRVLADDGLRTSYLSNLRD